VAPPSRQVPNPPALAAAFSAARVQLAANLKPCLLTDHPRYAECATKRLFVLRSAAAAAAEVAVRVESKNENKRE